MKIFKAIKKAIDDKLECQDKQDNSKAIELLEQFNASPELAKTLKIEIESGMNFTINNASGKIAIKKNSIILEAEFGLFDINLNEITKIELFGEFPIDAE